MSYIQGTYVYCANYADHSADYADQVDTGVQSTSVYRSDFADQVDTGGPTSV